jgi:hypothetical protein
MKLTLSVALMLVSGQITAELRDSINSKDRRIREDVVRQHMLSEYFSTVNQIADILKGRESETIEVKKVTFDTCRQAIVSVLAKEWDMSYSLYTDAKIDGNSYMQHYFMDRCTKINELEHILMEVR